MLLERLTMVCRIKWIWFVLAESIEFRRFGGVMNTRTEQGIYQAPGLVYFPIALSRARASSAPVNLGLPCRARVNSFLALA